MTAKEMLLENINAQYPQNQGYDSIEIAVEENPYRVTIELIDMVCAICDRLEEREVKK